MKVEAIKVFFDNNGLHRVGDIVEVENFDANLMKSIKPEKVVKKTINNDKKEEGAD